MRSPHSKSKLAIIDATYRQVMRSLINEYKTSRAIVNELTRRCGDQVISKSSFIDYINGQKEVPLATKLAIISAYRMPSEKDFFKYFLDKIVSDDNYLFPSARLDGWFRYWRLNPDSRDEADLRWGLIRLLTVDGTTEFEHWSNDVIKRVAIKHPEDTITVDQTITHLPDSEDAGFGFYIGGKLVMLGFRDQNIRLAIADVPDQLISEVSITGIVLSTRISNRNIFSSCFIMYHSTNSMFESKIDYETFRKDVHFNIKSEKFLIVS